MKLTAQRLCTAAISVVALGFALMNLAAAQEAASPAMLFHHVPGNLALNSSFEHDWFHHDFGQRRRFLLLQASDMGLAEGDGLADYWRFEKVAAPACWDTTVARTGSRSAKFTTAGRATQRIRFVGAQNPKAGGAHYAEFLPVADEIAAHVPKRAIIVGAWCRTQDVPEKAEPQLAVSVECRTLAPAEPGKFRRPVNQQGKRDASISFSTGTHDWEYREVRIEPADLPGTPHFAIVGVVSKAATGTVWFDDVSCREEPAAENDSAQNVLSNGDFEALTAGAKAPTAQGWSAPEVWTWWRNPYYVFTGWSHSERQDFRGGVSVDSRLAWSGTNSLRFTVLPGDNFAVHSEPIALQQDRPRPLEVRAMVKTDNLRALEIMALDDAGNWLPQGDFLGDDMEDNPNTYNMASTGCGTSDWQLVRKYFSPAEPVKSLRLFLCVRGFDGKIVEKNVVGTAWLDDVRLVQLGTAAKEKSKPAGKSLPAAAGVRLVDIDLGERLWGKNRAVAFASCADVATLERFRQGRLEVVCTSPKGEKKTFSGSIRVLKPADVAGDPAPAAGYLQAECDYRIDQLAQSSDEQGSLELRLVPKTGAAIELGNYPFGTPRHLLTAGVSGHYLYPDETLVTYANLQVARGSLADLDHASVVVTRRADGAATEEQRKISDFSQLGAPQTAPGFIDTHRLVQQTWTSDSRQVHPWTEPTLDQEVTIKLFARGASGPELLAASEPVRFGFLEKLPKPTLPDTIRKTAVNERGYITVNGEPWFPVCWTPHFGVLPEATYPPNTAGCKAVDLTKFVYAKGAAPDEEVKKAILAEVAKWKDEPRFFQYELGEGEMQLQGPEWKERNEWLKTAIGWIRAADPNHVINGPGSWLVGHPDHNEAMQAFIPHFDVIGVETSFETVPKIRELAKPLMKERQTAILVGLETYFYQPNDVIRWRGYKSVVEGAAGIGLCPSGMLQSRPDKLNYLRGLNAEFRALGPIIAGGAEAKVATASSPQIATLERAADGQQYLIAVADGVSQPPGKVTFTLSPDVRARRAAALFEDRSVAIDGRQFSDDFPSRYTVRVYRLSQ